MQVDRDVAVDDVAVLQHAVVGDPVADDLVHRGAQRLRVALVVERARIAAPGDVRVVTDLVERVGRDAGRDRGADLEEHFARGAARGAHAVGDLVGRDRRHQRRGVGRVRRPRDVRRYRSAGREATGAYRYASYAVGRVATNGSARRCAAPPRQLLAFVPFAHPYILPAPRSPGVAVRQSWLSPLAATRAAGSQRQRGLRRRGDPGRHDRRRFRRPCRHAGPS